MTSKLKDKFKITTAVILFIQLIMFYYIKYDNQNLPLSEFSISFTGNLFNLAVILTIILGLFFLPKIQLQRKVIIYYIMLLFILLFISFIATKINLPFKDIYIIAQPGDKIFVAFLFTLYQWVLFSFLSILWLSIINKSKTSLFKSFIYGIHALILFLVATFLYLELSGYNSNNWALSKNKNNIGG